MLSPFRPNIVRRTVGRKSWANQIGVLTRTVKIGFLWGQMVSLTGRAGPEVVREQRYRFPERLLERGHGPFHVLPGQALLDASILRPLFVVVLKELVVSNRRIDREGHGNQ